MLVNTDCNSTPRRAARRRRALRAPPVRAALVVCVCVPVCAVVRMTVVARFPAGVRVVHHVHVSRDGDRRRRA